MAQMEHEAGAIEWLKWLTGNDMVPAGWTVNRWNSCNGWNGSLIFIQVSRISVKM